MPRPSPNSKRQFTFPTGAFRPQFPDGHVPAVSEYARYYAGDISMGPNGSNSRRIVFAELVVLGPGAQPGIHMVANIAAFPQISDGGCTRRESDL